MSLLALFGVEIHTAYITDDVPTAVDLVVLEGFMGLEG